MNKSSSHHQDGAWRHFSLTRCLFLFTCFMLNPCNPAAAVAAPPATGAMPAFPKGTFSLSLDGSCISTFGGSKERIGVGSVGLGYYFMDNTSLSLELSGMGVRQDGPSAGVAEGDLLFRTHFFNRGPFSLFVDGGAGLSEASDQVPHGGTYFNFTERAGLGATVRLNDNTHLIGGARYFHLSNARLEGPLRNPSINAAEFYLGVLFTF